MATLYDRLGTDQRPKVLADCVRLIDSEMSRKSGLRVLPLKAGYKLVKGLRPGFVRGAMDYLLDEFCAALDPFYQKWLTAPPDTRGTLQQALQREQNQVAESLLGITDRKADRSTNRVVAKTYRKLRPMAKGHVIDALPGLGRTIEPYLKEEAQAES